MKKAFYKYILGGIMCLAVLQGCQGILEEPADRTKGGAPASLTLDIDLPVDITLTKSIATDPTNSSNSWSEWEKYVDGSLVYNFTLFVVNSDNRLVGYRQIHSGSADVNSINGFYDGSTVMTDATSATAIKVTFPQSDPLHGNIELLRSGEYTLIAVANYAPVTANGNTYAGLGKTEEDGQGNYNGSADLTSVISTILQGFSNTEGIVGFTAANYPSLFNYKLDAGDDRICKLNPQPLVMIRKVALAEGNNTIDGELSRTFARVRLEVNNKSETTILDISDLSFNGSFASKNAYLFNDVEAGTANFFSHFSLYEGNAADADNTKGILGVTSADAIVSASAGNHKVLASDTEPIFDAYILEGKIETSARYSFTFTATYSSQMEDGDATHNATIASFFSDNKYNDSSSGSGSGWPNWGYSAYYGIIDPSFYIFIRSQTNNTSTCLKADVQTMTAVVADAGAGNEQSGTFKMAPEFVWEIEIPGGSSSVTEVNQGGWGTNYVQYASGYLKSLSTSLYVQPYDGGASKVPVLGTTPGDLIFKMDFGSEDEHGTVFCQYNGQYYYLNGTTCEWVGPVNNMNTYKMLTFETMIAEPVSPKVETVESFIQTTNSSGATVTKHEIVRNDFFHGIIPVNVGE